jgi:hypothetical protein
MKEIIGFFTTIFLSLVAIVIMGKKRKSSSRYERSPHAPNDWQKLDRGIDPSE